MSISKLKQKFSVFFSSWKKREMNKKNLVVLIKLEVLMHWSTMVVGSTVVVAGWCVSQLNRSHNRYCFDKVIKKLLEQNYRKKKRVSKD